MAPSLASVPPATVLPESYEADSCRVFKDNRAILCAELARSLPYRSHLNILGMRRAPCSHQDKEQTKNLVSDSHRWFLPEFILDYQTQVKISRERPDRLWDLKIIGFEFDVVKTVPFSFARRNGNGTQKAQIRAQEPQLRQSRNQWEPQKPQKAQKEPGKSLCFCGFFLSPVRNRRSAGARASR
jgi:hypothetical protein